MRNSLVARLVSVCLCGALVQLGWAQSQPLDAQAALALASQNRPAVQAAKLKLEQARLSARALGAPSATKLGIGYSSNSNIGATDQDAFISQPLDLFGRTRAGRQTGEALVAQAEATYRSELLGLQSDVLSAMSEVVSAIKLSTTAESILKNAQQLKAAVDLKVEAGKVAEVQQTRAGIEVMRAAQNFELRRTQKRAALKRFAAELGTSITEDQLTNFPLMPDVTSTDVSKLPELLLITADLEAAKAEIGVAHANARPELEIQGLRSPWQGDVMRFGARVQLSWSFFDFGKSRNETKSAEKKVRAAEESLKDARMKAQAELGAAVEEFSGAKTQFESYQGILESARSLVRKTQIGYDEGASTLIDVLEATRALREVEEGLVEAEQRLAQANIAVYRAAGILAGDLK